MINLSSHPHVAIDGLVQLPREPGSNNQVLNTLYVGCQFMANIMPHYLLDSVTDFEGNLSHGLPTLLQRVHLPETAKAEDFLLPNDALQEALFNGLADVIENLSLGLQVVAPKGPGEHELPSINRWSDRRY